MKPLPPSPAVNSHALLRSAGRGAAWRIAGGAWGTAIRLAASMFLARQLSPLDFGVVGMAFLARDLILRVGALGMGSGVVAKKDLSQNDLSTAFWTDATVRLLLFAVSWVAAPLVAAFFRVPELVWVFRVVAITFAFSAVSSVSGSLLQRRMQFHRQELINGFGVVVESGLAVALAYHTNLAYWSLVYATIAASLLTHSMTFLAAGWRPSFHFSRKSFHFQFRFGAYGLLNSIFDYFEENIDYVVVGRLYGQGVLGLYEFAYRIPTLLHARLVKPAAGVIFPSLSQAQSDRDLVVRGFLKATRLSAMIAWPLLAALAALAGPVVLVLWGPKWQDIVPWLQVLCIAAAMNSVSSCASPVFMAMHRPDMPLKLQIPKCILAVLAVLAASWAYGVTGVALAMATMSMYYFLTAYMACRACGARYSRLLATLGAPAALAAASGACGSAAAWAMGLAGAGFLPALLLGLLAALGGTLACLYFLLPTSYKEIMSLIRTTLTGRPGQEGSP